MVKNLEFQIYDEKMIKRPRSLFMQKRLYTFCLEKKMFKNDSKHR